MQQPPSSRRSRPWASSYLTSTRRSRSTRSPTACATLPGRSVEEQGVREAMDDRGRPGAPPLPHPAARPAERAVDDREVPRQQGRHPADGLPVADIDAVCDVARARPAVVVRRAEARHLGVRVNFIHPRTPVACWSSSSSRPTPTEALPHTRRPARLPLGNLPPNPERLLPTPAQEPTQHILDAITAGNATADDFANLETPLTTTARRPSWRRGSTCSRGIPTRDKDPRKSLHRRGRPRPELGGRGALVAVMAVGINYNTVWTSIFEPVSTFGFLEALRRLAAHQRHDLPYHVVGSDLAGVVARGRRGRLGSRAPRSSPPPVGGAWRSPTATTTRCSTRSSGSGDRDQLRRPGRRRAGQANQLMPKPAHLTWEEAASPGLVNSTAYRQLVSPRTARRCARATTS